MHININKTSKDPNKYVSVSAATRLLRKAAARDQCFIISYCCRASSPLSTFLRLLCFPSPHQYCSIVPKEAVIREGNMERIIQQCKLEGKSFYSALLCLVSSHFCTYWLNSVFSLNACRQISMNLQMCACTNNTHTHTVFEVPNGPLGIFGFELNSYAW